MHFGVLQSSFIFEKKYSQRLVYRRVILEARYYNNIVVALIILCKFTFVETDITFLLAPQLDTTLKFV